MPLLLSCCPSLQQGASSPPSSQICCPAQSFPVFCVLCAAQSPLAKLRIASAYGLRLSVKFQSPVYLQNRVPSRTSEILCDSSRSGSVGSVELDKDGESPTRGAGEGVVELRVVDSGRKSQGFLGIFPSPRLLRRKILKQFASLPLAIGELFAIAGLCAVGTLIEQGENLDFYLKEYSENHLAFGFLTWRWIIWLGLDHVYTSPCFLVLLALLAASLIACTWTRQLPLVRVAQRWTFLNSETAISKLEVSETLATACLADLAILLMAEGYQVFIQGPALYAFKGLAGRLAPIGVHAALLMIIGGATLSTTGGYHGSVMVPQGLSFVVGDVLNPNGFLSQPTSTFNAEVHVNNFFIDNYPSGEIAQFHSDISLFDMNEKEIIRKTISVNNPLRFGGVTMYQTDWGISAIQVLVDGAGPFNLAVAPLRGGDNKLFGTFLPLKEKSLPDVKGISILARDLQSVVIYDSKGEFVGVRRPGSNRKITVDGMQVVVEDIIGSTGLEIKIDPGVPIVYAGFGAVMLTTCISYLSHSQVWALQQGTIIIVGGKSNRAKLEFKSELKGLLDCVPKWEGYFDSENVHGDLPVVSKVESSSSEMEQIVKAKEQMTVS